MTDLIEIQNFNSESNNDKEKNIDDDDDEKTNLTKSLVRKTAIMKDTTMILEFKKIEDNETNDDDKNDLISKIFCDNLIIDDDDEIIGIGPTSERWAPLGADNEETTAMDNASSLTSTYYHHNDSTSSTRIKNLEEEQEILTTSLMALTSHFAQVQFRLRQIVEAPPSDRDQLLVNLEEFAFRGIPEITGNLNPNESEEVISNLERARQRQFELIDRLKRQLTELEKFAYESGAPVLPQSILVEKQKIIIDELKNKLNLNVNDTDLPQLSTEDLRNQVDTAIGEFVGPLKMKEQLVAQLKTQITDLERFIAFLQGETTVIPTNDEHIDTLDAYNSYAAKKKHISNNASSSVTTTPSSLSGLRASSNRGSMRKSTATTSLPADNSRKFEWNKDDMNYQHQKDSCSTSPSSSSSSTTTTTTEPSNNDATYSIGSFSKAHNLLDKAATLLQMFAVAQFGCGSNRFQKNTLKKTAKCNHWGDLRAQLEVDIQEIISLVIALKRDQKTSSSPSSDDSDDEDTSGSSCSSSDKTLHQHSHRNCKSNVAATNLELTTVIRKNFAVTLQKLIQHGLRIENETATNLVPFIGCLNPTQLRETSSTHHHHYMSGSGSGFYSNYNHFGNYGDDDEFYDGSRQLHAWELILEYYNIKNGDQYNETPARKLSQSFNLDIVGGTAISNKQSLLSVIGSIIAMHSPYKRSYNSHFKAFVCAGLNSHKLVQWLNLMFQCTELIDTYYTSWSYLAKTGFRDSLKSIDRLTKYDFDLPVDLAIRQFQNIKDVFM